MAMKRKYRFTAVMLFCVAFGAWLFVKIYQGGETAGEGEKFHVVTSFYPVYIAAANLAMGCEEISLQNLSEPQTGCLHDFQLTPGDMKLLSQADLFLVNGGGMESFLTDTAGQYPDLAIVQTTEDVSMLGENAHLWMSVERYRRQVAFLSEKLCEMVPSCKDKILANQQIYDEKLKGLSEQQQEIRQAASGKKIVAFHEAFEYLAADYGLEICYMLNLDEERKVSAGEVADVLRAVRQESPIIFAEELYGSDLCGTVQKEAFVEVCYLDTLVRGDYDMDSYLEGMQENLNILKKAFGVD